MSKDYSIIYKEEGSVRCSCGFLGEFLHLPVVWIPEWIPGSYCGVDGPHEIKRHQPGNLS